MDDSSDESSGVAVVVEELSRKRKRRSPASTSTNGASAKGKEKAQVLDIDGSDERESSIDIESSDKRHPHRDGEVTDGGDGAELSVDVIHQAQASPDAHVTVQRKVAFVSPAHSARQSPHSAKRRRITNKNDTDSHGVHFPIDTMYSSRETHSSQESAINTSGGTIVPDSQEAADAERNPSSSVEELTLPEHGFIALDGMSSAGPSTSASAAPRAANKGPAKAVRPLTSFDPEVFRAQLPKEPKSSQIESSGEEEIATVVSSSRPIIIDDDPESTPYVQISRAPSKRAKVPTGWTQPSKKVALTNPTGTSLSVEQVLETSGDALGQSRGDPQSSDIDTSANANDIQMVSHQGPRDTQCRF